MVASGHVQVELLEARCLLAIDITAGAITPLANLEFDGQVAAFTDDVTPALPASGYTATIRWTPDGPETPGVVTGSGGAFLVAGTHTYDEPGNFATTITVYRRGDGLSASKDGTAIVSGPVLQPTGATIAPTVDLGFSGTVATFTDSNPDSQPGNFTAEVDWGDGSPTSAGSIAFNPGGGFRVTAQHTYTATGSFALRVTIVRTSSGQAVVAQGTAGVVSALLSPDVTAMTIAPIAERRFFGPVASFTFPDPGLLSEAFAAVIDWGDGGPTSPGTIAKGAVGTFTVSGQREFARPGTLTTKVTVYRVSNGQSGSDTGVALVLAEQPFSGGLDPISDTGASSADAKTSTREPRLSGYAQPFALIQVYSRRPNLPGSRALGQTIAGANGFWTLVVGPLDDGVQEPYATVTPPNGSPLLIRPLRSFVVDTNGPVVQLVSRTRGGRTVVLRISDELSGVDQKALQTLRSSLVAQARARWKVLATVDESKVVTLRVSLPARRDRSLGLLAEMIRDQAGNRAAVGPSFARLARRG